MKNLKKRPQKRKVSQCGKIDVGRVDNVIFTFKIKIEAGKFYYALECEAKDISIDYTLVFEYVDNGYAYQNYFKTGNCFWLA